MRRLAAVLGSWCLLLVVGCSGIPKGFQPFEAVHQNVSYRLTNETPQGFDLEVAYLEYSFLPSADAAIDNARKHFKTVAEKCAANRGHAIQPLALVKLDATVTRNVLDAVNTVRVGDRIIYAPK